jgi:hypothetical protein
MGPALQFWVPAGTHNLPSIIPGSSQVTSALIVTQGYCLIGAAVTSSQAGAIKIQPFLDEAGTMALPVFTQALTAGAVAVVTNASQAPVPFQSVQVIITNSSTSTANLSGFGLLFQAR